MTYEEAMALGLKNLKSSSTTQFQFIVTYTTVASAYFAYARELRESNNLGGIVNNRKPDIRFNVNDIIEYDGVPLKVTKIVDGTIEGEVQI